MRIERLEKRASEKQLVARPPWNNDAKDQRRVEVLRNRIEELDRRLAMLKHFEKWLAGICRTEASCSPNSPALQRRRLAR